MHLSLRVGLSHLEGSSCTVRMREREGHRRFQLPWHPNTAFPPPVHSRKPVEQKSLGKQQSQSDLALPSVYLCPLSRIYPMFLYNTFELLPHSSRNRVTFLLVYYYILQLKEMLASPLFNLREVNDLSDELGSLSAAIEVCYHRY